MKKLQNYILRYLCFGWLFGWGLPNQGVPCFVIGKEANRIRILPARILINVDQAIDIRYNWIDETEHAFVAHQDNYIGAIQNVPVYLHNVGEMFPPGSDIGLGSELWYKILVSSANVKIATAYEDYRDSQASIPFLKIGLIIGAVALFVYLYETGFIQMLLDGLTNK